MVCKADGCSDSEAAQSAGLSLTREQAVEIYRHKINLIGGAGANHSASAIEAKTKGQSAPLADAYGVSPKTIRDIWNRRTWAFATAHLWTEEQPTIGDIEISSDSVKLNGIEYRQHRGRPKGSRDKKPRTKKLCTHAEHRPLFAIPTTFAGWAAAPTFARPVADVEWSMNTADTRSLAPQAVAGAVPAHVHAAHSDIDEAFDHPFVRAAHSDIEEAFRDQPFVHAAHTYMEDPFDQPCAMPPPFLTSQDFKFYSAGAQSPTACDEEFESFSRAAVAAEAAAAAAAVAAAVNSAAAAGQSCAGRPGGDGQWTLSAVTTSFVDPFRADWAYW